MNTFGNRVGALLVACASAGALPGPGTRQAAAGEVAADPAVLAVLRGGDYAAMNADQNYLLWATSGKKLDQAVRDVQAAPRGGTYKEVDEYKLSGKASGAQLPDGECVALVRGGARGGSSSAQATANWRRGRNVVNHGNNPVREGTAVARFVWSDSAKRDVYAGGHVAFFAGYRSPSAGGGISIWDQNWVYRCVQWHALKKGGSGVSNPEEYYVVEVN